VTNAALSLILYAFVAAASPLGLAATLTVLRTGRPQALGLASGVVLAQLLTCGVLVVIGTASVNHRERRPGVEGVLELALGAALLVLAGVIQRRPQQAHPQSGRSKQILDRLRRVHGTTAFAVGLALGVGGPKRLVLTGLAAASITAAGLGDARQAALVLWYCALATIVVWAPVLAELVAGEKAVDKADTAFRWLALHHRPVTVWVLLIVGFVLVWHGLELIV
jgi:Sap-like sulfolipid-1-addressing protein